MYSSCEKLYAQFAYNNNTFSFCYGATYRNDQVYRHAISIDFWNLNGGCIASEYSGGGAFLELTNKSDYKIGLRYFRSPERHPAFSGVIGYLGAASEICIKDRRRGLNVTPQIGIHFPAIFSYVGGGISLIYGYDIPVIRVDDARPHNSNITLKLSLEVDAICFHPSTWKGKRVKMEF